MYRPSFLQHLEAIKKEFDLLAQENTAVKGMMKDHEERAQFIKKEIKTLKSCVFTMQQQIKGHKHDIELPKIYKPFQPAARKLKIGAGWSVENDHIADIKLQRYLSLSSAISSIDMSPDGKWVGISCNQLIYVYSMDEKILYSLNMKTGAVEKADMSYRMNIFREYDMKLVFSGCSKFLYTETGDQCIRKWDLKNMDSVKLNFTDQVTAWAPFGDELVVASSEALFLFQNGDAVDLKVAEHGICSVVAVNDDILGLGTLNGKLLLLNCKKNALKIFFFHTKSIRSLDVTRDKKYLISGSLDKKILISQIDLDDLELKVIGKPFLHDDVVLSTKFFDYSNYFVSGSRDYTIRIWNLDRREMRISAHEGPVVDVAVHGNTLVSASVDRKLRIWSVDFL